MHTINILLSEIMKKNGAKGGKASAKRLTKEQRSERASHAATTRWANHKKKTRI